MLRITVTIKGIENARRALSNITGASMVGVMQRGLNKAARQVALSAKERAPYRSGDLRRAIFWEVEENPDVAEARVVVPPIDGVPYGVYQHEGTGIYGPSGEPIRPKGPWPLRFKIPGAIRLTKTGKYRRGRAQEVVALEVRGVPPNPFLLDAFESARAAGVIEHELAESVRRAVRAGGVSVEEAGGEE